MRQNIWKHGNRRISKISEQKKKRKNDKTKIEIENMQNSKGRRMNCKEIKVRRRDMKRKNGAKDSSKTNDEKREKQ